MGVLTAIATFIIELFITKPVTTVSSAVVTQVISPKTPSCEVMREEHPFYAGTHVTIAPCVDSQGHRRQIVIPQ